MRNRLAFFPVTTFSIIMGLTGLTIALSKFYQLKWLSELPYQIMLIITSVLFLVITASYVGKALVNFEEVKADFRHKIRINFFSAFSISLLLLSTAYHPFSHLISEILWWVGVVVHTYLMLHTISFWIQHNFEIKFFNPAWFIPVVGNIIVPVMGVEFMPKAFSFFYFSVGAFFWIILFTIFFNRVVFHDQLPQKFIPTLFILIAPPAIGLVSYFRITGEWNLFSEFLINITYFFVLLLIFLAKSFRNLKFYISWWAFTFPLDALTIASLVAYQASKEPIYMYMSFFGLGIAVLAIIIVSVKTIKIIYKDELCVKED